MTDLVKSGVNLFCESNKNTKIWRKDFNIVSSSTNVLIQQISKRVYVESSKEVWDIIEKACVERKREGNNYK
jgi:hypothetical protein